MQYTHITVTGIRKREPEKKALTARISYFVFRISYFGIKTVNFRTLPIYQLLHTNYYIEHKDYSL
jgi:hypothetical protein